MSTGAQRSEVEAVGTVCVDGTVLSEADVARLGRTRSAQQTRLIRAVYAIASHVEDAAQCRTVLDMVGIDLASVLAARGLRAARPLSVVEPTDKPTEERNADVRARHTA